MATSIDEAIAAVQTLKALLDIVSNQGKALRDMQASLARIEQRLAALELPTGAGPAASPPPR